MDFGYVNWMYMIISIFYVQIGIVEAACVYNLKRRKYFFWRLLGCLAFAAGFLYVMAILLVVLSPYNMAGSIVYILVFALVLLSFLFCFDVSFLTLLFFGIAAYSVQNLSYRVFSILEVSGLVWRASHKIGYTAASNIIHVAVMIVVYAVLYFAFIRKLRTRQTARMQDKNIMMVAAVTLIVTVLLCAWTNFYMFHHQHLLIINYLFSIMCCLFILAVQSGMLERSELKRDIEIVNEMWERDKRQYEISKESVQQINVLCHDLKHKIKKMRIEESGLTEEELAQFEKFVSVYDSRIKTGCDALDVILTEKSLYCNKNGIRFTCLANGAALGFINSSDLYSLFGNILSNAIEAVEKIESEDKRSINLTVREVSGTVLITEENFFDGELAFKDGLPQTAKTGAHGYGMKSIKMLAEKYGGQMNCTAENGVFKLSVIFTIPVIK